jgi:hypothetical protein
MTVTTTNFKIVYNGNGADTVFPFSFACPDAKSLLVTIKDTSSGGTLVLVNGTSYTVALNPPVGSNPTPVGGTVTYPLSGGQILPVGFQISIVRSLSFTQNTSLANQSIIYPAVVEKALDYLTMLVQQGEPFLIPTPFGDDDA